MKTLEEILKNKEEAIAEKKATTKHGGSYGFSFIKGMGAKSEGLADTGILDVEVVANMAFFMDVQGDVLTDKCWAKSCNEKGPTIPFLHDHLHETKARIGTTLGWETKTVQLPEPYSGKTGRALVHKARVRKDYNESIYYQYLNGDIDQHSIGLQYIQVELVYPDKDDIKLMSLWNKYKNLIINFGDVEKVGYFWLVKELKLLENSAVWKGANELTPTLSVQPYSDKGNTGKRNRKFFTNLKSVM